MPGVLHSCKAQRHQRKNLARHEPSESQLLLGLEGVLCSPAQSLFPNRKGCKSSGWLLEKR